MRLNSDQLLSFVALVQHGSISAAAHARHLTQPAISNQLKRLQDQIGVALYQRQGRGVALTGAGERFYRHALAVQHSLQESEAFADALQGLNAGRIHLIASQTIAGSLLPSALVAFQQLAPHIEVFVDSGNSQQVFEQMIDHDLGLVESPLPSAIQECCQVIDLGQDNIVVAMRGDHPLAQQQTLTLDALLTHPLIWREPGSGTRDVLEQALIASHGRHPQIHLCLGGLSAVLEAARQGLGMAVVSQLCLPTGESILTTRPLHPNLSRPMRLLLPGHASPLARKFADFLTPCLQAKLNNETAHLH